MVNVNGKTPNKKRKSLENAVPAETPKTPKRAKLDGNNAVTPAKQTPKTPKQVQSGKKGVQNSAKQTPGKPNKTPKVQKSPEKVEEQNKPSPQSEVAEKKAKKQKGKNVAPTQLKMFAGTSDLNESKEAQKKRKGQFFNIQKGVKEGDKQEALKKIELRIKEISSRKELSKTAKRKLKLLEKLKKIAEHGGELPAMKKGEPSPKSESAKRRERKKAAKARVVEKGGEIKKKAKVEKVEEKVQKAQAKKTQQPPQNQQKKPTQVQEESDDEEESSESDYEVEAEIKPDKIIKTESHDDEDDESDDEGESGDEEESEEVADEEASGEEEESGDEDDDDDDEEDDDEEEEKPQPPKQKQAGLKNKPKEVDLKDLKENNIVKTNQKRYVLFVGNLPFDATREELVEHFKKIGNIKHVRIPTDIKTNKPRGFAYVEVENEESYQKGLSMHHSQIKGRRINVQYTQGGKKKGEEQKKEVKAKNFKLQAMRKQGQLAGSVKENQKRSARRNKKNKAQVNGS